MPDAVFDAQYESLQLRGQKVTRSTKQARGWALSGVPEAAEFGSFPSASKGNV